jgi:hypothetical protein
MIFKRGLPFLVAAFVAPLLAMPASAQGTQPSCPGDVVVWENTSTHVYHIAGDKYFGKTKHGAYACKADAEKNGFHAAGSGSHTGSGAMSGSMSGKHHKHHKGSGASAAGAAASPAASTAPAPAKT